MQTKVSRWKRKQKRKQWREMKWIREFGSFDFVICVQFALNMKQTVSITFIFPSHKTEPNRMPFTNNCWKWTNIHKKKVSLWSFDFPSKLSQKFCSTQNVSKTRWKSQRMGKKNYTQHNEKLASLSSLLCLKVRLTCWLVSSHYVISEKRRAYIPCGRNRFPMLRTFVRCDLVVDFGNAGCSIFHMESTFVEGVMECYMQNYVYRLHDW